MLWAVANTEASLYTVGLAIALYAVSAWLNHKQTQKLGKNVSPLATTKFFYPALGLIPLWSVYWLDYLSPSARHEHFGLILLAFGALGLAAGLWLERIAPRPELTRAYGLPAYLTGYGAIIVGTMLVAHLPNTLALALLYDAILMVASARIFQSALWLYPGTVLTALSLLIALLVVDRAGGNLSHHRVGSAAHWIKCFWLSIDHHGFCIDRAGPASIEPRSNRSHLGFWRGRAGVHSQCLLAETTSFVDSCKRLDRCSLRQPPPTLNDPG
jgi:hypothetical protein